MFPYTVAETKAPPEKHGKEFLEHFQRHDYSQLYLLAGISAGIFLGGVAMLWLLRRTPTVRRTSVPSPSVEEVPWSVPLRLRASNGREPKEPAEPDHTNRRVELRDPRHR
jgi:hypothetical protein